MNYDYLPPHSETIDINSFRKVVDVCYDGQDQFPEPPEGIVFCHAHWIQKFCHMFPRRRYVIVSGASDWCVVPAGGVNNGTDCWCPSNVAKAAVLGMRGLSRFGIESLPSNILSWFCANSVRGTIPGLHWLPFGLNADTEDFTHLRSETKTGLLYVNFQNHTNERIWLKSRFKAERWITIDEPTLPGPEFRKRLAQHKFVLCTHGCGLDCHRTYETLYAGSYPVMLRNVFTEQFADLPVLLLDSYSELTPHLLARKYGEMQRREYSYARLYLSWWKEEITNAWLHASRKHVQSA